jgi:aminoglycoside 6'-N-acetyltransferase I
MPNHHVREAEPRDRIELAKLRHALWPAGSISEHEEELAGIFAGAWSEIYPYVIFVSETPEAGITGFAEVTLRSRADGCDPLQPVGYFEGWYVAESHRRLGHGRDLLRKAEEWARGQGCREMASDTWLDNEVSQQAHEALGFEVVDRVVHFKKEL